MRPTTIAAKFTPSIKFLGKRVIPKNIDHSPRLHPLSTVPELPSSFLQGASGSGGVFNSIKELPKRFQAPPFSEQEMDNINSGGAEVIF